MIDQWSHERPRPDLLSIHTCILTKTETLNQTETDKDANRCTGRHNMASKFQGSTARWICFVKQYNNLLFSVISTAICHFLIFSVNYSFYICCNVLCFLWCLQVDPNRFCVSRYFSWYTGKCLFWIGYVW